MCTVSQEYLDSLELNHEQQDFKDRLDKATSHLISKDKKSLYISPVANIREESLKTLGRILDNIGATKEVV